MPRMSLALSGVMLVLLATGAEGQSVAPLRLGAGIGTSLHSSTWGPHGGHATLSLTSHAPGARLGFRVEALFGGFQDAVRLEGEPLSTWMTDRTVALTINPVFRLWGTQTGLYVMGGVGVYQSWHERRLMTTDQTTRFSQFEMGANLGVGFDFKAFDRVMFLESRLHSAGLLHRRTVTLGVRF